ncbi:carbohydrate esterase family 5 protein [Cadophora sp. DSE1049]|nr:carbohydrate esterase family 5 protein [Cadophora sp. DSE1049]
MLFPTSLLAFLTLIPLTTSSPLSIPSSLLKRATDLTLTSQNDLTNGTPCKALTIIFARGTVSPGNVGENVGPPFFEAVANITGLSNLAVQGVNYSADIFGFLAGGSASGSRTMAAQGAQLVHNSAKLLTNATAAKVSSVVMFGDPFNGIAVGNIPASKVVTYCHEGDNICEGGILVFAPHHTYSVDAPAAAAFVIKQSGLSF